MVEVFRRRFASQFFQEIAQDERAGVVVGTVAFHEARDVEDRVLEDSRPVAHAHDMVQPQRRQVVRAARERPSGERLAGVVAAFAMLMGEASESVSIIVSNKEALKLSASVNIPLTMVERANAALKGLRLAQSVSVIDVSVIDVTAG